MGRREDNKREKRERLATQGLELFLEQGYDRASIEQIAQASGVARGTFYLYFSDKLALFEALVDRWFQPLLDQLQEVHEALQQATSREESLAIYQDMAGAIAMLGLDKPEEILLTFRENRHAGEAGEWLRKREVQLQEAVIQLTELAMERGLITTDDPRLTSLVILGAVEKLYYEFLTGTELGDPLEMAGNVVAIFGKVLDLPME